MCIREPYTKLRPGTPTPMMAVPQVNLSNNDIRVLNALFDPETLPSSVGQSKDSSLVDPSLPSLPGFTDSQIELLESQQLSIVKLFQTPQAGTPTSHEFKVARNEFDAVVARWPNYPSAYLNRAELRRMKLESAMPKNDDIFTEKLEIEYIFRNLSRAIHIASPESPSMPVSTFQARVLRTAYSHRAYLYLKAAESSADLGGKGKEELEELASVDFGMAARFGDEVAREMSVRTNPYAKLCGAIVKEALVKERKEAGMAL